jgi:glycosyltransferase involved in cell wall biosynthesis
MKISNSELLGATDDPLVTVAIPTFNRVSLLKDCTLSALAQSYHRFEVLVSDNASTDGTAEFLTTIQDPRLRVVRQASNIGLNGNWNACLRAAKGDYVIFVSDDDRVKPDFLDRCIALIRTDPLARVVVGLTDTYYGDTGATVPASASKALGSGTWDGVDILLELLKCQIFPQMCTILIRTEAFRAAGGFPTDMIYATDLAAWAPLLLVGRSGLINEPCGTYVCHSANETWKHPLEVRLREHRQAVSLIAAMADHSIDDLAKRREVQFEARRNIANTVLSILIAACGEGRSTNILPFVWAYRRDVMAADVYNWVLLFTYFLLPAPMVGGLRSLKSGLRSAVSAISRLTSPNGVGGDRRRPLSG